MKRLLLILSALLACGVIAAGCGGDDDDDGGDDAPATTETAPPGIDTTGDEDTGDVTVPQDVESFDEEECKEGVQSSSAQLSEDLRNDLEDICEQAAEGDEEEIREASLDICKRVVEETIPEGPAREQGIEACEASAP